MTTDQSPASIVAAVLELAGSWIDSRYYGHFLGGPEMYSAIHAAATELITAPAIEHARRRAGGIRQLQHWRGDKAAATELLRTAAGTATGRDLAAYQSDSVVHALSTARDALCDALDAPTGCDMSLSQLTEALCFKLADATRRLDAAQERIEVLSRKAGEP